MLETDSLTSEEPMAARVLRRNRMGCKAEEMFTWPDEAYDQMDSALAVQQYIQQLIRSDFSKIDQILSPPENCDEGVWKYEHLRQFCMQLNTLAVYLQSECIPSTCKLKFYVISEVKPKSFLENDSLEMSTLSINSEQLNSICF